MDRPTIRNVPTRKKKTRRLGLEDRHGRGMSKVFFRAIYAYQLNQPSEMNLAQEHYK